MAEQPNKKKKKGLGIGWLIFVVFIMLSNLMENADSRAIYGFFRRLRLQLLIWERQLGVSLPVMLVTLIVVVTAIAILIAAAKKKAQERQGDRPSTAARTSAAVQRRDPRTRSFTEPDAYCFSCEATGEDHFQRDKQTRIRQLDDWLKNGLIDRDEYRVLKARFERDL